MSWGTPWRAGAFTEPWRRKCFQGTVRLQRRPGRGAEDCPGPCGRRFIDERRGPEGPGQGLGLELEGRFALPRWAVGERFMLKGASL